jgi:hypothetical protein
MLFMYLLGYIRRIVIRIAYSVEWQDAYECRMGKVKEKEALAYFCGIVAMFTSRD